MIVGPLFVDCSRCEVVVLEDMTIRMRSDADWERLPVTCPTCERSDHDLVRLPLEFDGADAKVNLLWRSVELIRMVRVVLPVEVSADALYIGSAEFPFDLTTGMVGSRPNLSPTAFANQSILMKVDVAPGGAGHVLRASLFGIALNRNASRTGSVN